MKCQIATVLCFAAALAAGPCGQASGCAVPVFRYALERWQPDTFLVIIRHGEALNTSQQALVEKLRGAAGDPRRPANVDVLVLDRLSPGDESSATEAGDRPAAESPTADQAATTTETEAAGVSGPTSDATGDPSPSRRRQWLEMLEKIDVPALEPAATSPQMLLLMPLPGRAPWPVWTGPLNDTNCRRLIDSPAREAVIKQILEGQSAVWVLVASGHEDADTRAEETLRTELARMEKALELPSPEALAMEPSYRAESPVELRIGFSVLVLKKDDPDETIFRAMLLASEPDLVEFDDPIAIPVFGRGRTYYALVGKGIHPDMIEENCRFLCDGCSCVVKQENPGVDMLMAVAWEAHIDASAIPDFVLPELTGIGEPPGDAAVAAEGAEAAVEVAKVESPSSGPQPADPGDAVVADRSESTATAVTDDAGGAVPETHDRFGRHLLLWTLAGVGVAVLLVGVASLWIKS